MQKRLFQVSFFLAVLLSLCVSLNAQLPAFSWVKQVGMGNQNTDPWAIHADAFGNTISAGLFYLTADFDPGPGTYNMTAVGMADEDHFLLKLDASGNFVWAKQFDLPPGLTDLFIRTDASGNVYFSGTYGGTIDFDPGPGVFNLTGTNATFVVKLDAAGNFVWAKNVVTGGSMSGLRDFNVTANGEMYFTGKFQGSADFDPGVGTYTLVSPVSNYFASHLDASGNLVWAAGGNSDTYSEAIGIEIDPYNNIYISGMYVSTVDFDPGQGVQNHTSIGYQDIFMLKLDASGNFVWAKFITGINSEGVSHSGMDAAGHLFLLGHSSINTDFDPGPGTYFLSNLLFTACYDMNGNLVWVNGQGSYYQLTLCEFSVDPSGNSYFGGYTSGATIDFDPGPGVANFTPNGTGGFIRKLDASGNFEYLYTVDGPGTQSIQSCAVGPNGQTYATGIFVNTIDFDPGPGVASISNNNYWKGFVVKLNECSNGVTMNQTACDSYTLNGQTYTQSGIYTQTLQNSAGCDSSIILNLSVTNGTSSSITQTACDSYTLNGQTYTASGTYTQLLTNSQGCDSTLTLHLTITNSTSSSLTQTACDSYTLNGQTYTGSGTYTQQLTNAQGCDSTLTLHLTITNSTSSSITQTACDSYTLNGQTYTVSGTYTQQLTNAQGCDSTLTLHLTLTNSTSSSITQTACDSYTLNGQTYTVSDTYTQLLTNSQGCDSTLTLHLTINSSTSSTLTQTSCDSYTLNGQTYTSSGTYTQQLTNSQGCDSTLTLHLTINSSTSSTLTQTSCDNYTLNGQTYTVSGTYTQLLTNSQGCDSTLTLHLTITHSTSSSITQTACDSYTLNGQLYTSGGTYTQVLTNTAGCDSIVTLNLTIVTIDNSVTQNNHILTASESNADYQWIGCHDLQPIAGANTQVYTATANGDYAVIVNNGTCVDTSACYTVVTLSVEDEQQSSFISVFPNPAVDMVTIYSELAWQNAVFRLYTISGTIIREISPLSGHTLLLDLTEYSAGIYFVEIHQATQVFRSKLVKN